MRSASRSERSSCDGAGRLGNECQQEPERIAVGHHGVRADAAFAEQSLGEESLQRRSQGAHELDTWLDSSRRAASPSSSGVACRYQ